MDLSKVKKGGTLKPPRVLVYGPAGVGKTTFAADARSPIAIPIEDGLGKIAVDAFPSPRSYSEVREALDTLINEEHDYKTVIVDSLDWLEPLMWKHTCEANSWTSIEQPGFGKGYVEALRYWREFLDRLNYLRDAKGMTTILIGHSEIKPFQAPDSEGYDRYVIKLQKAASALVSEHCDVIGFAQFKSSTVKSEERGRTRTRAVGSGERVLYTEERPAYLAKNRYGLPPAMELNWESFAKAIKGEN